MGDYAVSDAQLAVRAARDLGSEAQRSAFVRRSGELLDILTEHMDPWKRIVGIPKSGPATNRITDLRTEYINLTATGLVVIGRTAFEIFKTVEENQWSEKLKALAQDVDWRRDAEIWKGSIVTSDGKILTNRKPIDLAAKNVENLLGIGHRQATMPIANEDD